MKQNLFSVCLFSPRTLYFPPQKGTETKELKIRKTLKKAAGFPNLFMAFASPPHTQKKKDFFLVKKRYIGVAAA